MLVRHLFLMRQAQLNKINRPRVIVKAPTDFTPADRVQFLSELKAWGDIKGFKPGWAAVQYKERFGGWPPWSMKSVAPSMNVGAETMGYINQRKKEWKKAKKLERERTRAEAGEMPISKDDWIDLAEWRA